MRTSKLKKSKESYERSVIIMPDDTVGSITEAINNAKISIRVKMFLFSDPGLIGAIIAAKARGCKSKSDAQSCQKGWRGRK